MGDVTTKKQKQKKQEIFFSAVVQINEALDLKQNLCFKNLLY